MRAWIAVLALSVLGCHLRWGAHDTPHLGPALESVARFDRMPTTLAVAPDGRLFVNFPNWWSQPRYAVALVKQNGALAPYPDASWNAWDGRPDSASDRFVCVQALHIDRCGERLWIVDSGNPLRTLPAAVPGGPKLVSVDLKSGKVERVFRFDAEVAPPDSYLNDVRVDPIHQTAYLTDSGMGALLVVDLKTGTTRRVLADHPSTKAEACVVPVVGGQPWRAIGGMAPRVHADGIALDPSGETLYFHALTARTLYRVPTAALRDARADPAGAVEAVATTAAVDGMYMDLDGALYLTAIEHDAIERWSPQRGLETVVRDGLIQWPDAIVVAEADGQRHLYFTASQIHKGWAFNHMVDVRSTPFEIFRVPLHTSSGAHEAPPVAPALAKACSAQKR